MLRGASGNVTPCAHIQHGHLGTNANGQLAVDQYCTPADVAGWRRRPRTTLPTALDKDLQEADKRLRNQRDLDWLRSHDRSQCKNISENILKAAASVLQ
ncbi:hypothetical protein LSAT2_022072 [Lamellibrachia satsuma]|nr:hypothetical protein LSAT2_022072 [Lamellibrachia satsuma]